MWKYLFTALIAAALAGLFVFLDLVELPFWGAIIFAGLAGGVWASFRVPYLVLALVAALFILGALVFEGLGAIVTLFLFATGVGALAWLVLSFFFGSKAKAA